MRSKIDQEDAAVAVAGIGPLGVDEELAIARKDGVEVALIRRRVVGDVLHVPRGELHQVNLVAGASLRLLDVGQPLAIRRPNRRVLGSVFRGRQVLYFSGLGRDGEDVPLLVAVIVRGVGDPVAVGRPGWVGLPLIADG